MRTDKDNAEHNHDTDILRRPAALGEGVHGLAGNKSSVNGSHCVGWELEWRGDKKMLY